MIGVDDEHAHALDRVTVVGALRHLGRLTNPSAGTALLPTQARLRVHQVYVYTYAKQYP